MLVQVVQDFIGGGLGDIGLQVIGTYMSISDQALIAQYVDVNVFDDIGSFLENFVSSGQIWALVIGFILGYLIKGLTSYG
jgi:fructose-specific phosphotransferase system IIC component